MEQTNDYSFPDQRRPSHASAETKSRKPWQKHAGQVVSRQNTRASQRTTSTGRHTKWWQIRWFRGMIHDIHRRAPFYVSDWTDAWDYRVVPATIYMYFAK